MSGKTAFGSGTTLQVTTLLILRCEPRREADATGVRPMPRASLEGRTCDGPIPRPERRRHQPGSLRPGTPSSWHCLVRSVTTHASPFPRLFGRVLLRRSPRLPWEGTRGEAPSGAEAMRPPGPAGCPTGPDFGSPKPAGSRAGVPMKSPDQASGLLPRPPAREPARLTALHRGTCRPPGPRVRGGGCGRKGPHGASPPLGPRRRRGPRDGSSQAARRRGRPPLPLPPTDRVAPAPRFRSPAQRCSSRNGHPRRKSASRARTGGVPGDALSASAGEAACARGTAPPPHRPHHRTMPR